MKISVFPDAAMMIVHLITKNGHEYLSSTNITEEKLREKDPYDDSDFDKDAPPFTMVAMKVLTGNKYTTNEAPSGVRGRLSLYDDIINKSDAAIVMGKPPKRYNRMYNLLNELILFGCILCENHYNLSLRLLRQRNIPILEVPFPTTREEIIDMIDEVNTFLQNLEQENYVNRKVLTTDLREPEEKILVEEFDEIAREINNNLR